MGLSAGGFVAVDWGTSNRRAYRLAGDGTLLDEMEDGLGILNVPPGGFPAAVAEIRARFPGLPVLLAGMVGSNRGWVEAPYMRCPAGAEELAAAVRPLEPGVAIVPGVALETEERVDVMRGEEVQIVGAVAEGLVAPDTLLCHPGTHNKWVRVADGRIVEFRTVMTGELYSLLRKHSILSTMMKGPVEPGPAFQEGVERGLVTDGVTAELFTVRANVLLGRLDERDAAARVSGLLIGSDLRVGLGEGGAAEPVPVVGGPGLTRLYAAAIRRTGREAVEIEGERAFIAGMRRLAETVQWS